MFSRRQFVKLGGLLPLLNVGGLRAHDFSTFCEKKNPTIKSITLFRSTGNFVRFIGMNAYDTAPKGINANNPLAKIVLSDNTIGIGPTGYTKITDTILEKIKPLIGVDPFTLYNWSGDRITGVAPTPFMVYFFNSEYCWIESALLDAIGKIKQKPVWKLFGEPVRNGIDPYDGSLYFEEIANNTSVAIIGELGKRIKNEGYRAIKMKLGRPFKWLPGEAGLQRDIEVVAVLREAVGNNFIIMTDANNGYKDQFEWAVKLMKACARQNVYFMEELFPDDADLYKKLRQELLTENLFVPIADGESIRDLTLFEQYCRDGIYNFIQPDMATCGFSNILKTARMAESYAHVKLVPHVWQNQLGLLMSLHLSKIQKNIPFVEDSRFFEHAFNTSAYQFSQGQWFIPDRPGWGFELSEDYKKYQVGEEIVLA